MHSDAAPMIHPHGQPPDVMPLALFGAGALWGFVDAVYRGLPPWNLVPPLLFGAAALVTAVTNARRAGK